MKNYLNKKRVIQRIAPTILIGYLIFSFFLLLTWQSSIGQISGISTKSSSVNMDISIGEYQFSLFGYTSANALVTIQGMGIYDQTYADNKGYFEFHNRFSPFSPREACLTARDQFGRTTSPTCIPPFPTKYDVTIGPVLMPPTLSLDKENYWVGDEVRLSGQTTPNSEVNFSVFTDKKDFRGLVADSRGEKAKIPVSSQSPGSPFRVRRTRNTVSSVFHLLVQSMLTMTSKPVEAFTFPNLTTRADAKGNFSLSLPSSRPEFFRLFAQTSYDKQESPESVKLNLKVLPVWMIIIQLFILLWSVIKSRLLEMVILIEIVGLIVFFLRRYLHPRSLAIIRRQSMAITRNYAEFNAEIR